VLRQDIRRAVERACALATEHRADVVLIPGDLFDYESLRPDTVDFLTALLGDLAPARVFIAPGNHDGLRPGSPYLPRSEARWPANVHAFTAGEFETVPIPELDCAITGIAHAHRGITDRLLGSPIAKSSLRTSILLFHGSRDGYRPAEKQNVIPFSDGDLLGQGFAYAAIGHYHSFSRIEDAAGCVRAAYSGCAQGRGLDETGPKFALVGEIDPELRVIVEPVEVAERRIVAVEVNLTGAASGSSALARVRNAVEESGARECDIVHVSLTGALTPGLDLQTRALEESARHFHVTVSRSRLGLDYDLDELMWDSSAPTLRSNFVRKMSDMLAEARDDEQARVLRDAISYGLCALDGLALEPRDVD
jgi:DNA repair exonuclease SbcCD nuclease subunit